MRYNVLCDLDDEQDGNTWHIAGQGVIKEEVEEVLAASDEIDISRTSGRPIAFGYTIAGRYLMVAYEFIDADTIYPVTAYDVPERGST